MTGYYHKPKPNLEMRQFQIGSIAKGYQLSRYFIFIPIDKK